jgi:hypothetical protein
VERPSDNITGGTSIEQASTQKLVLNYASAPVADVSAPYAIVFGPPGAGWQICLAVSNFAVGAVLFLCLVVALSSAQFLMALAILAGLGFFVIRFVAFVYRLLRAPHPVQFLIWKDAIEIESLWQLRGGLRLPRKFIHQVTIAESFWFNVNGIRYLDLVAYDELFDPHTRHRIAFTTPDPDLLWQLVDRLEKCGYAVRLKAVVPEKAGAEQSH